MLTYTSDVTPKFGIEWPKYYAWEREVPCWRPASEDDEGGRAECVKELGEEKAQVYDKLLTLQPKLAKKDPVTYGWLLPQAQRILDNWDKYDVFVVYGGNGSGKSLFCSALTNWLMRNIPHFQGSCFHQSEKTSIESQQIHIWNLLHEDAKALEGTRERSTNIRWSDDKGFTGRSIILPPQSEDEERGRKLDFNFYSQWRNNKRFAEGRHHYHWYWFDEEADEELVLTMMKSMREVKGKVIISFTTLDSWTNLVSAISKDAETIETRYAPRIGEELPVWQESGFGGRCGIFYFWSDDNPFVPKDAIWDRYKNSNHSTIKARMYGVPVKNFDSVFGMFNEDVHVVKHEDIPFIKDPEVLHTKWCSVDPAPKKPWVMIKAGIMPDGDIYVYEEFPMRWKYGAWAEPRNNASGVPVGEAGPAQRSMKMGPINWAKMMKEWEDFNDIYCFIMDKRFAGSPTTSTTGHEITWMQGMAQYGVRFVASRKIGSQLAEIDKGIQAIQSLLNYDDEHPISEDNRPKLYFSENVGNMIKSMTEYSNCSREEHWKDFVDALRYLITYPMYHVIKDSVDDMDYEVGY